MAKPHGALAYNPYARDCPSRRLLDLIGDRWTVLVIGTLGDGPRRFSEIQNEVGGVSQKMLTQTLRALERDGLLIRTVFAQVPPRVDYELTPTGRSLLEPLKALTDWATANMSVVHEAQTGYDAKVGAAKVSAAKVGAAKVGAARVGTAKVSAAKVGVA